MSAATINTIVLLFKKIIPNKTVRKMIRYLCFMYSLLFLQIINTSVVYDSNSTKVHTVFIILYPEKHAMEFIFFVIININTVISIKSKRTFSNLNLTAVPLLLH